MLLLSALAFALQAAAAAPDSVGTGARNPSYARDGRLAVSIRGDLWVLSKTGQWTQITSGPAWDREPAWTPDGSALVFSSDRSGNFDLWRVAVGTSEAEPTRVTTSPLPDGQPAVARDGRIIFVRGRLGAAALWVHSPDGTESRLTRERAVEEWPAISADGSRLAYVAIADGSRKLHVRNIESGRDTVALSDARVERPSWS